ncbi:MAG: MBL fold metallo-hydrolase [Rickettsiales bacterium]|nr:MBL fold metallo-hydrolase [Rickettsiales bacterium]
MKIQEFYDKSTGTFSYLVICDNSNKVAIIDSVADIDVAAAKISYDFADILISYITEHNLELEWILETHIHADHLTAANYIKDKIGGKIAVNENFTKIKEFWSGFFDISVKEDAFDYFLKDGETIHIGKIDIKIILTPGHTPACSSFIIGDNVFVGDVLLDPSIGCARCDFPGGSAEDLYHSVQKIYALGDDINVYVCHDYPEVEGKQRSNAKVRDHKEKNVMIAANISKQDFIEKRQKRDSTMAVPRLLLPSIQVNINAGFVDKFIKLPVNKL